MLIKANFQFNAKKTNTFSLNHIEKPPYEVTEKEDFTYLPNTIEKHTPIGCKVVFESFMGADGAAYADILMVYASAAQLRAESALTYDNPPMAVKIKLQGLKQNADGLYSLSDVEQRLSEAIQAYDSL